MAKRFFCAVIKVAQVVVKFTEPEYSQELLGMLPADLRQAEVTDKNINHVIARINRFCHEKEDTFAKTNKPGRNWGYKQEKKKKPRKLLGSPKGELSLKQEILKREIKFLSNLARSIYELKFI